jgi:hypothetical protein
MNERQNFDASMNLNHNFDKSMNEKHNFDESFQLGLFDEFKKDIFLLLFSRSNIFDIWSDYFQLNTFSA